MNAKEFGFDPDAITPEAKAHFLNAASEFIKGARLLLDAVERFVVEETARDAAGEDGAAPASASRVRTIDIDPETT